MKSLIVFIACAGIAVGQTTPTPIVVQEPVTQPVLHCPDGWHVEVWHEPACWDCGGISLPITHIDDRAGYVPYLKPIEAGAPIADKVHPAKCVKNPPAPKPDAVTPETTQNDKTFTIHCGEKGCTDGHETMYNVNIEGNWMPYWSTGGAHIIDKGDSVTRQTNPLCTDHPSGSDEGCKKVPEHAK